MDSSDPKDLKLLSKKTNLHYVNNKSRTPKNLINRNANEVLIADEKHFEKFSKNILLVKQNSNKNPLNYFHNKSSSKLKEKTNNLSSKSFSKSGFSHKNSNFNNLSNINNNNHDLDLHKLNSQLNSTNKILIQSKKTNHIINGSHKKNFLSEKLNLSTILRKDEFTETNLAAEHKNKSFISALKSPENQAASNNIAIASDKKDKYSNDVYNNSFKIQFAATGAEKNLIIAKQQKQLQNENNSNNNNNISNLSNKQASFKSKLENKAVEPEEEICRICYDEQNAEKGELIRPCLCTGTMKSIHQSCLKTWIENNLANNKLIAHCEICQFNYQMKIDTKYVFCKKKCVNLTKTVITSTIISAFILCLIFILLYLVVSGLTTITNENKGYFICIISGIISLILLFIILSNFRNYKNSMFNQIVTDWKIDSLTGNLVFKV